MLRWLFVTALVGLLAVAAPNASATAKAEHIVLIVWDGMRPDFVTEKNAPNLTALSRSGVFFNNNHAAYTSSTNVNGAVLATGDAPERTGIIANQEYRPEIDPLKPFDTSDCPKFDDPKSDVIVHYLGAPTIAELVQKAGFRTAVAGSKPVAQLFDRARQRESDAARQSAVVYRGHFLPKKIEKAVTKTVGAYPNEKFFPRSAENAWTTRALTEFMWKNEVPKFSLLWLSEPDLSQHEFGPGSPNALAAIKSDDDNLGRVLEALRAKNALATTDIMVVSDHGFSTIHRSFDVAKLLREAGFDAVRAYSGKPKPGQILVLTLGGSVSFYIAGHDGAVLEKLIDFLQRSKFAGVILTRAPHPGTFTYAQAQVNSANAPDLLVANRWSARPYEFGTEGEIASDLGKNAGQGSHSTFSPYDLNNTLIASGPDFRQGWKEETPTGNIDVAPTIMHLLGLEPPEPPDGRVLLEALRDGGEAPVSNPQDLAAERDLGESVWRQTLRLTTVGSSRYFLEGNGGRASKQP